jgi:hypothetical protein
LARIALKTTRRWRDLYRGRAAVEREFGRLKNEYGLAPLRVRGIERVALHADLVMLARLSQALARARAIPLAAYYSPPMKTAGAALALTALVIVACYAWIGTVDDSKSTAGVAYVTIGIVGLFAIILIWLTVFVVWMKRRFANRNAKPS